MNNEIEITLKDSFNCSLETAFKTPILSDGLSYFGAFRFMPKIFAFSDDSDWGEIGGKRIPQTNGNFWIPSGGMGIDIVIDRQENRYWKWRVNDFQIPMLFFLEQSTGEWFVSSSKGNKIVDVIYRYSLKPKNVLCYPFCWIFVKLQWKPLMKKILKEIKQEAESGKLLKYDR